MTRSPPDLAASMGPADVAPRQRFSRAVQRLAVERQTPVVSRREGRGATLAHARGVTDPDAG